MATGERGEARFRAPAGVARVSAWTEHSTAGPTEVEVVPNREVVVELVLAPSAAVEGRVLDARTGAPISGAELWVSSFQNSVRATTDTLGRYALKPFPVDERGHVLRCEHRGYASDSASLVIYPNQCWRVETQARGTRPNARVQSVLQRGFPVRLDMQLLPARMLIGRVLDPVGSPIEGAEVRALGHVWIGEGVARPDEAGTRTDEAGRFELQQLRPDITYSIEASMEGFARLRTFVSPGDVLVVDVGVLELQASQELHVLVLAADGTPAEGAVLRLHTAPLAGEEADAVVASRRSFPRDADYDLPLEERTTDAEGYARFEHAAAGAYRLDLRVDGRRVFWRDLELQHGSQGSPVLMELSETLVTLRGMVLRDGVAISNAVVHVEGVGSRKVLTSDAGVFVLAGNEPDFGYSLHATWTDPDGDLWESPTYEVTPVERSFVELVLARPGS
ncbi:MAG TPA: carboxypeptidase regulatory-like domain-containing protein [Planctomycetota bacterium]|nr:carboxypeptidase regulatory-like domain-containing protein [Planctomycetota bacterium]